jgi:hypothetical protein
VAAQESATHIRLLGKCKTTEAADGMAFALVAVGDHRIMARQTAR